MPRYTATNDTAMGDVYLPAGVPVDDYQFIQVLPYGVTIDKTVYCIDPIIASSKVSSTSTYTIPDTDTGYTVKLFCLSGEVSFKINTVGTSCLLGAGMTFEMKCRTRSVDTIDFTITTGVVYVTITKG